MKDIGVSVYPDFYPIESIRKYLERAKELSFRRVFMSLILNDLGFENSIKPDRRTWGEVLSICRELGLEASADINAETFKELGCSQNDLKPLADMGITRIRIDSGFTKEQMVLLTGNRFGISIEINGSLSSFTANEGGRAYRDMELLLKEIKTCGSIDNVTMCHNFFPLPGTGLSLEYLKNLNGIFKAHGVKVGGFVASQVAEKVLHKTGHGVCTVEAHRYIPPHIAMAELFAEGFDYVLTGDGMASGEELEDMSRCAREEYVEIPVVFHRYIEDEVKRRLLSMEFISRVDQPEQLIRATGSRGLHVSPCYCAPRNRYAISLNNSDSSHYMGELQIALQDMGSSAEANVIGFVHPFGVRLLECIKYGKNRFKLVEL
ncbi:MAG TPA: MupG family TIM beta-alpha barrel fold protein [Bacillota bacterium]|nr:MupG family TIM beta-alpha barrel fold protein [Bacillota bacterium]